MRSLGLALAAAAALFAGADLSAAADGDSFTPLVSALTGLRDNDYAGDLDKTQAKELKAIVKSLDLIDGGTGDYGTDVKTASKVVKTLEKAIPGAFTGFEGTIQTPTVSLFNDLTGLGGLWVDSLDATFFGLSEKENAKIRKYVERARAAQQEIAALMGPDYGVWTKALAAIASSCAKAQAVLDRASPR